MPDLDLVYGELRAILEPFAERLEVTVDSDAELSVNTGHRMKNGSPLFFGAVQIKKRYVSFHLMPVYVDPGLLTDISDGLQRRMQGKSCFNFTTTDEALFAELAGLVEAGYESYRDQGYV